MNAPMKKQTGPVLYLVDQDPRHKAATCVGCRFARIFDFHFVHCDVQNPDGSIRLPIPGGTSWDNRGKQAGNGGVPNTTCPYIHRVKTWEAGKRVPRTFQQMLRDLSYERGWVEECPGENNWYFKKGRYLATANFNTQSIHFTKLLKAKNV